MIRVLVRAVVGLVLVVALAGCADEPNVAEQWDLPIDEAAAAPVLGPVEYLGSNAAVTVNTGSGAAGWVVFADPAEGSDLMADWPDGSSIFEGQDQPRRVATIDLTDGIVELRAYALTAGQQLSPPASLTIDPDAPENDCGRAFEDASIEARLGSEEESALVQTLRDCEREQWMRTATYLPEALGMTRASYPDAQAFLGIMCRSDPEVGLCAAGL